MCFFNLLVNGVIGIVVGMVINILLYNLGEFIDVVKLVMDNFDVIIWELMEVIFGLDFFIGVLVMGCLGIYCVYEIGKGLIVLCLWIEIEIILNGKECIVVIEFLYGVNKIKVYEYIVCLV